MQLRIVAGALLGGLLLPVATVSAQTAAPAGQQAYVEEWVTRYQPAQQRVIVPVREYRTETRLHGWWNPFREPHYAQHLVPVTRWEERLQTTQVPVTVRQYRPVMETSLRPAAPLRLATRPGRQTALAPGRQVYDNPPMVAITAPPAHARTAQAPRTTLAPQTFKPAARAPVGAPAAPPSGAAQTRGSTWSR